MQDESTRNIAGSSPRELNLVTFDVSTLGLRVDTIDNVAVGEFPVSDTLGLVEAEVALEAGAIWVTPLALGQLTVFESSDILLACLLEDVGALTVFLAAGPHARVDILVGVGHDALAMALAVLPVAVIFADASISLLANSVLAVVKPLALVSHGFLALQLRCIGVVTFALAFLHS